MGQTLQFSGRTIGLYSMNGGEWSWLLDAEFRLGWSCSCRPDTRGLWNHHNGLLIEHRNRGQTALRGTHGSYVYLTNKVWASITRSISSLVFQHLSSLQISIICSLKCILSERPGKGRGRTHNWYFMRWRLSWQWSLDVKRGNDKETSQRIESADMKFLRSVKGCAVIYKIKQ
jgi:hypothetical protein